MNKFFPSLLLAFLLSAGGVFAQTVSVTAEMEYDKLGRLKTVDYGSGNRVTNEFDPAGNLTKVATTTPVSAPQIALQSPAQQTISAGSQRTLTASISGALDYSLQWYAGSAGDTSAPIIGAIFPSFTTPSLNTTSQYWLRATNRYGFQDSGTITLTVPTRIIATSPTSLDFGTVTLGTSPTQTLTISNTGNSSLTIASLSYPPGFSGNWTGGTLGSGSSQSLTVTFTPTTPGPVSGTITLNSNATGGPNAVAVTATAPEDSDADGLPDAWEITYFGNPSACDPIGDNDNDGLTNRDEYLLGRHPLQGPWRKPILFLPGETKLSLKFAPPTGTAILRYEVEAHSTTDGQWTLAASSQNGTSWAVINPAFTVQSPLLYNPPETVAVETPYVQPMAYDQLRLKIHTTTAAVVVIPGVDDSQLVPVFSGFVLNAGAAQCGARTVDLNHFVRRSGYPFATHYRASEDEAFTGAVWLPYTPNPIFQLSEGSGSKTVYFQTKFLYKEAPADQDSIVYQPSAGQVLALEYPSGTVQPTTSVVTWGSNSFGQRTLPSGLRGVTSVSAGGLHTTIAKSNGEVLAWGFNINGQTAVPSGVLTATAVASGWEHTMALLANGTVRDWGYGELLPPGFPTSLNSVRGIAAGDFHAVALKTDGSVAAWGRNLQEQTNVPSGLSDVQEVVAGGFHSVALKSNGTLVAWGYNASGQTTIPGTLNNVSAIAAGTEFTLWLKQDGTMGGTGTNFDGALNIPAGLNNVESISGGGRHVAALKRDGSVVCWGSNDSGQSTVPPDLTNVVAVDAGGDNTVALTGTRANFGSVELGTTRTETLTLRNNGEASLVGSLRLSGTGAGEFTLSQTSVTIAPGTSAVIDVSCSPTVLGFKRATLSVGSNAVDDGAFVVAITALAAPFNARPTIGFIPDQIIDEDSYIYQTLFTIGDAETAPGDLVVTMSSSNQDLVRDVDLGWWWAIPGSGDRMLVVVPQPETSGTSTITITVSDGASVTSRSFLVTVNPVDDAPRIMSIAGVNMVNPNTNPPHVTIGENTSSEWIPYTVDDVDTAVGNLQVSLLSIEAGSFFVDPNLVQPSGLEVNAVEQKFRITPALNRSGETILTLRVTDGTTSVDRRVRLLVVAPEIVVAPLGGDPIAEGSTLFTSELVGVTQGNSGTAVFRIRNLAIRSGDAVWDPDYGWNAVPGWLRNVAVTISGADAGLFSVATQPDTDIAPQSNSTFEIRFTPTSGGERFATIHVHSNDSDEADYDFQVRATAQASPVASLQSLALENGLTLVPAFSPQGTAYQVQVEPEAAAITLTVTPQHPLETLSINGNGHAFGEMSLALNPGVNVFRFTVTAENGETNKIYTLVTSSSGPVVGLDLSFTASANGRVNGLLPVLGERYMAFGTFFQPNGRIMILDNNGDLIPNFTANVGANILTAVSQIDGKYVVGGIISVVSGVPRNNIARLNPDGSLDVAFNPDLSGAMNAMLLRRDEKILITGSFGGVGGLNRPYFALLNQDGSLDPTFAPAINAGASTIAEQDDGMLLIGGGFTFPRQNIARLTPTGEFDNSFNASTNQAVSAISCQADGSSIIGGSFTMVNGQMKKYLAGIYYDGALDTNFNVTLDGDVTSIVTQANGVIAIAGHFTEVNGSTRVGFAVIQPDGVLRPVLGLEQTPTPPAHPGDPLYHSETSTVALDWQGRMLITGEFEELGGIARNKMARLFNEPVVQSIEVTDQNRVFWQRGGSCPETTLVRFELLQPNATTWQLLGFGIRASDGWELEGLTLPLQGKIRALARTQGGWANGSSGMVDYVQDYTSTVPLRPEIALFGHSFLVGLPSDEVVIENGAHTPTQVEGTAFMQKVHIGSPQTKTFTVRNTGAAPLNLSDFSFTGSWASDYSISQSNVSAIPPGGSGEFVVTFAPQINNYGFRQTTLHFKTNDLDEKYFSFDIGGFANSPPEIFQTLTNRTMAEDGELPVTVFINDFESDVENIEVHVTSSNELLIGAAGVSVSEGTNGFNNSKILTFRPRSDQNGQSTITVTVIDPAGGRSSRDFVLTVTPVDDPPVIDYIPQVTMAENTTSAVSFQFFDQDTSPGEYQATAQAYDASLVPPANIVVSGIDQTRSLVITPTPNMCGETTVAVEICRGTQRYTRQFQLMVTDVLTPLEIFRVANFGSPENLGIAADEST